MATRVVEWKKPYTWWVWIEITDDKVINLRLRDENNLIIYDRWDNEIYVDLQLDDELRPTDAFPVWITTGRVLVDNWWDVTGTIICAKTTSGDNIKFLYWDNWTFWMDNWTGTFKQIYFKSDVDIIVQALQTQIDVLSWLGKFLSLWDCETWEPISFPISTPYEYSTWDWYMISNTDTTTNYRPNWSEYDGTASTTVETSAVDVWDVYIYDGTVWLLQKNAWGAWWSVTFSEILWQPTDNTNLATALNNKADLSDVLTKTNTTSFTPSGDYNPATKKYVDDSSTQVWTTAPSSPTEWMLWYDTTNDVLKSYDWSSWNTVGSSSSSWLVILSYGNSTWNDFLTAYTANRVVYCKASSNSNPWTWTQSRMAFMAYVNDPTTPTEVEFQYYRSRSSHNSDANQVDEVYVYKLNSSGTWTVTVRDAAAKIVAGTWLASAYNNGVNTISLNTPSLTVTLASTDWSNNSQEVTATGVTASNTVIVSPAPSSINDYTTNKVYCSWQASNKLTFTCNTAPSNNITVNVAILN